MKKTKLIMPIIGLSTITASLVPLTTITSCSKTEYNKVTLDEKSSATRIVGQKAENILFQFKQENLKECESTKVKLSNLTVAGAAVTPVDGLVKSIADSAGNIVVDFNIATAKTHYSAESVSFDLVFTNKKANTEYTLTGFSIAYEESGTTDLTENDFWDEYKITLKNYAALGKTYKTVTCENSTITETSKEGTKITNVVSGNITTGQYLTDRPSCVLKDDKGNEVSECSASMCYIYYFANTPVDDWQTMINQFKTAPDYKLSCTVLTDKKLHMTLEGTNEGDKMIYSFTFDQNSYLVNVYISVQDTTGKAEPNNEESYINISKFNE